MLKDVSWRSSAWKRDIFTAQEASLRLKSSHDFRSASPRSLLRRQNKTNPHNSDKSAGFSSAALISLRYISGITRCSRFMAPSTCGDQSDSADNCWVWVVIKWTTKVPWFITRRLGLTSSGELSGKGRGGETRDAVQECRSNRCQGRCFHSLQL